MNRRGFLKFLGGGAGVAAVAAVAPSQVWPFRKIFLPTPASLPTIRISGSLFHDGVYEFQKRLNAVEAVELEFWAKEVIPDLVFRPSPLYDYFKRLELGDLRMANGSKIIFEPGPVYPHRPESDLALSEVLHSIDRDISAALKS